MVKAGLVVAAGTLVGGGAAAEFAPVAFAATTRRAAGSIRFAHVPDVHLDLNMPATVAAFERFADAVKRDQLDLDFVLFGGDNFNNNAAPGEDAQLFGEIARKLPCPAFAVRGNKEAIRPESGGYTLAEFKTLLDNDATWVDRDWKVEVGDHTVLGIDTTLDGMDNGTFSEASLSFVEAELAAQPGRTHILLTHHAFENFWGGTDSADLHKYVLSNTAEVQQRLFGYENLDLLLSGHKHRNHSGLIQGKKSLATVAFVTPQGSGEQPARHYRIIEIDKTRITDEIVSVA
jgi:Icc protein